MATVCTTQLKQNLRTGAAVTLLVAVVLALCYVLYTREPELLDPNQQPGQPAALAEEYGYSELMHPSVPAVVRLCGMPRVEGKDVYLNLTSPEGNYYLLRAEIYDVEVRTDPSTGQPKASPGKLLGRTGFIRPGTFVEKLELDKALSSGETPVYIKIGLREEETGHSGGFFYVTTTLVK